MTQPNKQPACGLNRVTITGADNTTDIHEIIALSREYPWLEWGILVSMSRTGVESRYPGLPWIDRLNSAIRATTSGDEQVGLSVHLCGRLARTWASGSIGPAHMALSMLPTAQRIQINLGKQLESYPHIVEFAHHTAKSLGLEVIIQAHDMCSPVLANQFVTSTHQGLVSVLEDASGGHGIDSQSWQGTSQPWLHAGYAGGITPENVDQKLRLAARQRQSSAAYMSALTQTYWIDMESGVRTQSGVDSLDMNRVRSVINQCEQFRLNPQA